MELSSGWSDIFRQSFLEEVVSIWKVRLLPLLIIGFGPGFGNRLFHVLISFFVHFFHHSHDVCSWIFLLFLATKLHMQRFTFSSLNCICDHDLFSFLTRIMVMLLFLRTYLQSVGTIYPQSFFIAKIWLSFLYPFILISTDQFVKIT